MIAKVGNVAYKLELLPDFKIHLVFHVSLLKKKVGDKIVIQTNLPSTGKDDQFQVKPIASLHRQQIKRNNVVVVKVLVQ